jgi:uracil-DNA glycosylase
LPDEVSSAEEELLLNKLSEKIVNCKLCPRLINYIEEVGSQQTKRFMNQVYWARPVPTFGDPKAKLLVIGLAPAAHGGNRTGRIFTGDSSGDWLVRALRNSICKQTYQYFKKRRINFKRCLSYCCSYVCSSQ